MNLLAKASLFRPAVKVANTWIDGAKATYDEIAQYIWEHPELSLVEYKAAARLTEYLGEHGFRLETGISGMPTAFVATWGSGRPVIGFLAEYDALPNLSQDAHVIVPKPIVPGAPGQGCGHNLMGTSSATAAISAAKAMEKLGIKGTLKVFGTPAEETLIGKLFMTRDGVFDDTDIMLSWHPRDINSADYNTYLAMKSVKFQFHGRSAHGGTDAHQGRSALSAAQLMNTGVNFMREHLIPDARVHYIVSKGGEAPNNVPPFAENYYFLRAPRMGDVTRIWDWVIKIAKGAALMTETKMTYDILTTIYERLPNRTLARMGDEIIKWIGPPPFGRDDQKFGRRVIQALGRDSNGESFSTKIQSPDLSKTFPDIFVVKASNDQGNISWKMPILNFSAATRARGTPNHSWATVCQSSAPAAMKAGLQVSKWLAASALKLMTHPKIIEEARAEFNTYLAEFGRYEDPISRRVKIPSFETLYGIKPEWVPTLQE
jgi:aminobenzoyl-glutamate utilization protein B